MVSATVLACTELPMPKLANVPNRAKAIASHFQLRPKPNSIKYIGPPDISPLLLVVRYFTANRLSAYLVAIPTSAVTHIQNTAPGPPATIAVATPAILPVPIVADKAVINAPKCDTSPSWSCFLCEIKVCFKANGKARNCKKPKISVK